MADVNVTNAPEMGARIEKTLTPADVACQINRQFERLMMLQELTRMTLESLPYSTDSDVPNALLNGMQEILAVDAPKMYYLSGALAKQAAKPGA
jgi:hypothetical protein